MFTTRNCITIALVAICSAVFLRSGLEAPVGALVAMAMIHFRSVSLSRNWTNVEIAFNLGLAAVALTCIFELNRSQIVTFVTAAIACSYIIIPISNLLGRAKSRKE